MNIVKENDMVVSGIIQHFEQLPDPRTTINRRHLLVDIIVISICAVIANADGPIAIAHWACAKEEWLKKYLALPFGIPSHDTIGRVLQSLKPQAFQECFVAWLQSLREQASERPDGSARQWRPHIAIDGKTARRSHDRRRGLGALHVVSAWATEEGIALGQLATEEKSNEITAIPVLLEQIEIAGAIVTIDAAGCQKKIANKIMALKGDYVLALKGNQGTLHAFVEDYILGHMEDDFARTRVSRYEQRETNHGRREHRIYYQLSLPKDAPCRDGWAGISTIGVAIRMYEQDGKETSDVRYYISSLKRDARQFGRAVRRHWGIENTLHWCLDMTFREDESRVRERTLSENLAWLRRTALTLIKQHPYKESLIMKRRIAGWNDDFLMQVLTGKGA